MEIKIKKINPSASIPKYAHPGSDSGFDLVAVEDVIVRPGETVRVPTGLAFEIPPGFELQIRPRSGITSKAKLRVQLGTVDSGYNGEVGVIVDNVYAHHSVPDWGYAAGLVDNTLTPMPSMHPVGTYIIRCGDRIAQGVIAPVIHAAFEEVDELSETERGSGGFGSSGVNV